jgi:hypothetical protein
VSIELFVQTHVLLTHGEYDLQVQFEYDFNSNSNHAIVVSSLSFEGIKQMQSITKKEH